MGKRGLFCALAWLAAVSWVFAGPLFAGRALYYRDVSVTYFPDYVFVSRALRSGLWPLWHPAADAGTPFLMAYPVDLSLLLAVGPRATLALSPALHVLLAMVGMGALARRLGIGPRGAFLSGAVFGLSGMMLGSVLYPSFLAAAWAPLALALFLAVVEEPRARRVAALALVLALQVSTLGAEAVLQTGLAALALIPARPGRRAALAVGASAALATLLAAPAWLGARALLAGSARGLGFAPEVGLSYSASLPVLIEAVLPRFLGDPHTFSEVGYWGQPFFPAGSPFFLSLYLGPGVLLLAVRAGRRERRLWSLVLLGILLSLGAHGPLAPLLAPAMQTVRGPVKFFLLATLGLSLLAGRGIERPRGRTRLRGGTLVPGVLVLAIALWSWRAPGSLSAALAHLVPPARGPLAQEVIRAQWPGALAVTGALTLGAGLALVGGGRLTAIAALLVTVDLLQVNGALSPSASPDFYGLLPGVRVLVGQARPEGAYRWFSYGVARSPPLEWSPAVAQQNSDAWLFYLDRQSLLPRTHVLDGLEGAFDIDRMGLAPRGSTLTVGEADPRRYREIHERLRRANVRWALAFHSLPADLVRVRGEADLPGVRQPLRLYELREPVPRAFWVARLGDDAPSSVARGARPLVRYERLDPHTVRIEASTPPGFLVILDGHHPDWKAEDRSGDVPLLRTLDRYCALPTPGGEHEFTLRYRPAWRPVALGLCGLGVVGLVLLARPRGVSPLTRPGTARAMLQPRVPESVSQSDKEPQGDALTRARLQR